MNLSTLDSLNERILMFYLSVASMAVFAVALTTWFIADRAMRPLRRIESEVSKVTPAEPGKRIEVDDVDHELAGIAETLNEVFQQMEAAFKAQNDFLTNAAHELRTPVAVLLGEAQIIQRSQRTPQEYADYVASIQHELRRLANIITGMLTLAKTRAGTRILGTSEHSANDLIMESMENCQALAAMRGIVFAADLALYGDDDVEPTIVGDKRLLLAMFDNIIRNAIRVSPIGERIAIQVKVLNRHIGITIADRGPGIPEDKLHEVFKDFKSIPVRGATNGGAGIGLAIARSVAELHAGRIEAGNRSDGGAVFTVELPIAPSESAESEASPQPNGEPIAK